MENEEMNIGCLGDGAENTDYLLCDGDGDLLPKLYKKDEIRFEYNQANQTRSKVSCTIFSAMGVLADLKNYDFTLDEMKEVDELSYLKGRIRGQGRYTKKAFDLVVKWWNETHADLGKVAYYRISKYSNDLIKEAIEDKLYTIGGNFGTSTKYSADYRLDGMLDGTDFGRNTNGHATNVICYHGQRSVKDSYKGRKTLDGSKDCNIYGLKHQLSEITNRGDNLYIITNVAEDNFERVKELNEFKTLLVQNIENNSKMRHLTNDEGYKNKLHAMNENNRKKLADINEQLKKLT